jgi:signal transduction histidine kinase
LRREAPLLLPATLVLFAGIAFATLGAYRAAVDRFGAERAVEALALAQRLASELPRARPLHLDELQRGMPPDTGFALIGADGRRRASAGAISDDELPAALLAEARAGAAVAFGPERTRFPAVVACVPLTLDGEPLVLRVDLAARALAGQRRTLAVLTPLVLVLSIAAIVVVALFLRALLRAEARVRLAEGLAQLGELSAGVAHELRNSVAAISGWVTLARREPLAPAAADCLEEIDRESRQLSRVVGDFLTFARPGTRRLERVDLGEILRRSAHDPAGGVAIELRLPAGEAKIVGDEQLLERAIRNLVANAVEATREAAASAPVELDLAACAGGWQIDLCDRGAGIPAALRGRLFEPFATGRPEGVGLGLALARRIVLLHEGTIEASDREGGGTRFRIELPSDISDTKGSR